MYVCIYILDILCMYVLYIYNDIYNHILYNILLCIIFIHILEATNPQFPRCCCPIRFKGVATTEIRFTEVGLSSFSLFGNVCVLLAPLVDSVPIFAGGQHSFRSWIWHSELLVPHISIQYIYIYYTPADIYSSRGKVELGSLQPHKAVCELWFCGMMKNPICKWWKILSENEFAEIIWTTTFLIQARSTSWICPTCIWPFLGCLQSWASAGFEDRCILI